MAEIEIVFMHGAGDSADVWERQVASFGRDHRVAALDLPGHGTRLAEAASQDHAENGRELIRQARAQGLTHPVLVGHSAGGAVVLSAALAEPAYPAALVLVCSGARLRMHPDVLEQARQRAETAEPGTASGPFFPMETTTSPAAASADREWLRERLGRSTAQATAADFAANNGFDVMSRLGELRVPTLVVGGADDRMAPPKFQQYLADNLPDARLVLIEGAGHYPQVEQTARFNEALRAFLDTLG